VPCARILRGWIPAEIQAPVASIAMPPVDSGQLNQHPALLATAVTAAAKSAKAGGQVGEAPVRTHEDGQRVAQGKHLE